METEAHWVRILPARPFLLPWNAKALVYEKYRIVWWSSIHGEKSTGTAIVLSCKGAIQYHAF